MSFTLVQYSAGDASLERSDDGCAYSDEMSDSCERAGEVLAQLDEGRP